MKLKDLLTDESKWTQHANARDAQGNRVGATDPAATQWCLMGAIFKVYGPSTSPQFNLSRHDVVAQVNKAVLSRMDQRRSWVAAHSISGFNDSATWPEIKSLLETLDV